jgi:uncharacterized membrane protein
MGNTINQITRNETQSVTDTSSLILPKNSRRQAVYIRNSSSTATDEVTIHFGEGSAVANEGIVLTKGGYFVESTSDGYECFKGSITAISNNAGGVTISILEK